VARAVDFDLLMGLPSKDQWVLMEHLLLLLIRLAGDG